MKRAISKRIYIALELFNAALVNHGLSTRYFINIRGHKWHVYPNPGVIFEKYLYMALLFVVCFPEIFDDRL